MKFEYLAIKNLVIVFLKEKGRQIAAERPTSLLLPLKWCHLALLDPYRLHITQQSEGESQTKLLRAGLLKIYR